MQDTTLTASETRCVAELAAAKRSKGTVTEPHIQSPSEVARPSVPTELIPVPLPRSLAPTTSNQRSSTQASTGQDARNADAERGSAAGQTVASPPASSSGAQAADQKSAAAQAFDLEPPESLPEPAPQTQAPDTDRIPWPATPEAEDELGGDAHSGERWHHTHVHAGM